jgi:putative hydrolase of HD superfamily
MDTRLHKQVEFCREIDKEKLIDRQTYLTGAVRFENDAEHAWHAALMAILLKEYANEDIDILKVVTMLLIHDIVEIDAGDAYAYDADAQLTQRERELAAADRIFGMLPDDQRDELRSLWEEFEARETAEAKFAHTMDNFQPVMLNDNTDGKRWAERQISLSQIMKRNERTAEGSETLWNYSLENFIMPNVDKGRIKK